MQSADLVVACSTSRRVAHRVHEAEQVHLRYLHSHSLSQFQIHVAGTAAVALNRAAHLQLALRSARVVERPEVRAVSHCILASALQRQRKTVPRMRAAHAAEARPLLRRGFRSHL
eukprot:3651400-Rhodomonas_salina.1